MCYVLGDEPQQVFPVEIVSTKTVAVLRKTIAAENIKSLGNVGSNDLRLWAVSTPLTIPKLLEVPAGSQKLSQVFSQITTYFPQVKDGHLHVIVERREHGSIPVLFLYPYLCA